jgi:hypothetical protein
MDKSNIECIGSNNYDVVRPLSNNELLIVAHELYNNKDKYIEILKKYIQSYKEKDGSNEQISEYQLYTNMLTYGLENGPEWTITQIIELVNEMKYRKADKPSAIFKSLSKISEQRCIPHSSFQFGKPACVTEKMDGSQVCIDIWSDHDMFTITSHSGGQISPSKITGIIVTDINPQAHPGHKTLRDHCFQGGNLTQNFQPLIPLL